MPRGSPASDVSVVVPVRDGGDLLFDSLASFAAQEALPGELVIVDDGSTDGTPARVAAWAAGAPFPCRALATEPGRRGACAARNLGWQAARGQYVQFADADDLVHPARLRLLAGALADHPRAGLAWAGFRKLTGTAPAWWPVDGVRPRLLAGDGAVAFGTTTFGWACLFRRQLVAASGGWDERLSIWQDFEFVLRVAWRAPAAVAVDAPLTLYRVDGPHRISRSGTARRRLLGQMRALRVAAAWLAREEPGRRRAAFRRRLGREWLHLYRSRLGESADGDVLLALRRALRGPLALRDRAEAVAWRALHGGSPAWSRALKRAGRAWRRWTGE